MGCAGMVLGGFVVGDERSLEADDWLWFSPQCVLDSVLRARWALTAVWEQYEAPPEEATAS